MIVIGLIDTSLLKNTFSVLNKDICKGYCCSTDTKRGLWFGKLKNQLAIFFLKASMQKLEVSLTTDNYPASFLASTKLCIEGKWAIFRSHWRLALHDHCCSTNCSTNETWALIIGIWKGCKRGNSKKGMQEHPFRLHICIEQSLKKSRKRSL